MVVFVKGGGINGNNNGGIFAVILNGGGVINPTGNGVLCGAAHIIQRGFENGNGVTMGNGFKFINGVYFRCTCIDVRNAGKRFPVGIHVCIIVLNYGGGNFGGRSLIFAAGVVAQFFVRAFLTNCAHYGGGNI